MGRGESGIYCPDRQISKYRPRRVEAFIHSVSLSHSSFPPISLSSSRYSLFSFFDLFLHYTVILSSLFPFLFSFPVFLWCLPLLFLRILRPSPVRLCLSPLYSVTSARLCSACTSALQRTNTEISNLIFPEKKLRGHTVPISTFTCVCERFIYPAIDLPILLQDICGPILGIYKSLTDTWIWKLGLRSRNSQKRNT